MQPIRQAWLLAPSRIVGSTSSKTSCCGSRSGSSPLVRCARILTRDCAACSVGFLPPISTKEHSAAIELGRTRMNTEQYAGLGKPRHHRTNNSAVSDYTVASTQFLRFLSWGKVADLKQLGIAECGERRVSTSMRTESGYGRAPTATMLL